MVLRWLPVTHNKAVEAEAAAAALGDSPIKSVLRSKGFMWLSNKHTTAFYWSHAGEGRASCFMGQRVSALTTERGTQCQVQNHVRRGQTTCNVKECSAQPTARMAYVGSSALGTWCLYVCKPKW